MKYWLYDLYIVGLILSLVAASLAALGVAAFVPIFVCYQLLRLVGIV